MPEIIMTRSYTLTLSDDGSVSVHYVDKTGGGAGQAKAKGRISRLEATDFVKEQFYKEAKRVVEESKKSNEALMREYKERKNRLEDLMSCL